jgi:hydroxyacylglutathione hydrolase
VIFKRITSEGLSHHSYFIADGDEAVVVDPKRDVDTYLNLAAEHNCNITKIIETHRNEDYVIGSVALKEFSDSEILHGGKLDFKYGTQIEDGTSFDLGNLRFNLLETPGHTPESITISVADKNFSNKPFLAFVGDSLFVGDTGRTDLWGDDGEAASALYESLYNKILPLGDHVILCAAHGGGSVCGGAIAKRNQSTLGYERQFNPKLQKTGKNEFVKMKNGEQHVQAPYFKLMEEWNQTGKAPVHRVPPFIDPLNLECFREKIRDNAEVIDLRPPQAFASAHIPNSYNIWQAGVPAYFGWIASLDQPVVLVLPEQSDPKKVTRLLYRIGYDNVCGYLKGGFETWQNESMEIDAFGVADTEKVKDLMKNKKAEIIDVRKPDEWEDGTIEGSHKIFLGDLENRLDDLDKGSQYITMCAVGHRGGVAASILAKSGFRNVYNYLGGYTAWKQHHA